MQVLCLCWSRPVSWLRRGGENRKTGRHLVTRLGRHPVSSRRCSAAVGRKDRTRMPRASRHRDLLTFWTFLTWAEDWKSVPSCAFKSCKKWPEVACNYTWICGSRLIVICWSQWAFWFGCFVCLTWQIDERRLGWELPQVGWDASTLQRLMRFLHGGPSFIRDPQDLDQDWINPFIGDGFCFVFLCVWWVWCASIVSLAFLGDFFPVTVSLCHAFLVLASCTWLWAAFRSHPKTSPESLHHQGETPHRIHFFFPHQALHCADFFGMNVLVAHSNTWIVEHLDHDTAPRLWSYVDPWTFSWSNLWAFGFNGKKWQTTLEKIRPDIFLILREQVDKDLELSYFRSVVVHYRVHNGTLKGGERRKSSGD